MNTKPNTIPLYIVWINDNDGGGPTMWRYFTTRGAAKKGIANLKKTEYKNYAASFYIGSTVAYT